MKKQGSSAACVFDRRLSAIPLSVFQPFKMDFGSDLLQINSHAFRECSWNICCPRSDQQVLPNGVRTGSPPGAWRGQVLRSTAAFVCGGNPLYWSKQECKRGPVGAGSEGQLAHAGLTRPFTDHMSYAQSASKSRPVTTATAHARQAQARLIYGYFCKGTEGNVLRSLQENKFAWLHMLHSAGDLTGGKLFRGEKELKQLQRRCLFFPFWQY